jgi:hypothetical protein
MIAFLAHIIGIAGFLVLETRPVNCPFILGRWAHKDVDALIVFVKGNHLILNFHGRIVRVRGQNFGGLRGGFGYLVDQLVVGDVLKLAVVPLADALGYMLDDFVGRVEEWRDIHCWRNGDRFCLFS